MTLTLTRTLEINTKPIPSRKRKPYCWPALYGNSTDALSSRKRSAKRDPAAPEPAAP